MSVQDAQRAIDAEVIARRTAGFECGGALATLASAAAGGYLQQFANATVYWHARTGAHEVHGGILTEYLRFGGPGTNPAGGASLGYPTSPEMPTPDGRYVMNRFEFGAIYWVRGVGAVAVAGDYWHQYTRLHREDGPLGTPIQQLTVTGDVEALHFEFGGLARQVGTTTLSAWWAASDFPRIGRPAMFGSGPASWPALYEAHLDPSLQALAGAGRGRPRPKVLLALAGRLALVPSDSAGLPAVPIGLTVTLRTEPSGQTFLAAQSNSALADRTLYDLVWITGSVGGRGRSVRSSTFTPVSEHAVYAKADWRRFGFAHITDLHVAARQDRWHSELNGLPGDAFQEFVNYNDGLRQTILAANTFHAAGDLDLVLATGDLVDFAREDDDSPVGPGNFGVLTDIICGRTTSPSGVREEPLKVPIFMVPGNHDYRPNPYLLRFKIDIPWYPDEAVDHYEDQNLTAAEAEHLQQGRRPTVSTDAAHRMVVSEIPEWLRTRLIGLEVRGSYTVALGPHRVVMIDTGADLGVPGSLWSATVTTAGFGNEDSEAFLDHHSPNLDGITRGHLTRLERAIDEAGQTGVVIVGMHAPPFNPYGNEHAPYFRESVRASLDAGDIEAFVARHVSLGPVPVPPGLYPEWDRTGTPWFKRGSSQDLLDLGVARGDVSRFIALCAGAGGRRPADLILAGHAHRRADYRLDWDSGANEPRYYFDFYFGQPGTYYRARMAGQSDPVWIEVVPGAAPNGRPVSQSSTAPALPYLAVPPNPDNFADAANPESWWRSHRPFVCQTAATGPLETYQRLDPPKPRRGPTFRGFRYGHVDQDALVDFHYLALDAIRAAGYWRSGLPASLRPRWLRATRPAPR